VSALPRRRPDIPAILPPKHARPSLRRVLADGLRYADRPWSIGIDIALLHGFRAFTTDREDHNR